MRGYADSDIFGGLPILGVKLFAVFRINVFLNPLFEDVPPQTREAHGRLVRRAILHADPNTLAVRVRRCAVEGLACGHASVCDEAGHAVTCWPCR
jgi:hypothetical protein